MPRLDEFGSWASCRLILQNTRSEGAGQAAGLRRVLSGAAARATEPAAHGRSVACSTHPNSCCSTTVEKCVFHLRQEEGRWLFSAMPGSSVGTTACGMSLDA